MQLRPAKDTHMLEVPFKKDPEGSDARSNWIYRNVPIYWPHEVLQYVFETVGVRIDRDTLLQYWREAHGRGLPWAADGEHELNPRIPIKFFGDDATYNKQGDHFMGFILSCPIWRPHASRNSRWPVAVVSLYGSLGYATLHPILHALVWSLNVSFDFPLACGYAFQVTEVGGDWKYLREAFNMTTHWNSDRCCHFCEIHRVEFPSLPQPLPHRSTNDFIRDVISPNWPSPLILLRKFNLEVVQWCLLHTCHLGLLWTANGGAMDYLLNYGVWGPPRLALKTRLLRASIAFKQWRKLNHVRCSQRPFSVRMLYKGGHGAYLSCKGWNSRIVCAWLAEICESTWTSARYPDGELTLLAHAMLLVCG